MKKFKFNTGYIFILPAVIGTLVFVIYPVIFSIVVSFMNWDLISGRREFVGLDNYIRLLNRPAFIQVLRNTGVFMLAMVVLTLVLAFLLALALNKSRPLHNFVQTAIFTPHVIAVVSVAMLWQWIMHPNIGLLNYLLEITRIDRVLYFFGIEQMMWLASGDTALLSLVIIGIWNTLGYNTIILLAGLQSIPPHIYEAAALDRTSKWRKLIKITLPLLSPSLFFLLIINVAFSFQTFEVVSVLTGGGPLNATNMLVHWIHQTGFMFFQFGEASVGSVFLFVIVGILTFVNFKLLSKRVHYQ